MILKDAWWISRLWAVNILENKRNALHRKSTKPSSVCKEVDDLIENMTLKLIVWGGISFQRFLRIFSCPCYFSGGVWVQNPSSITEEIPPRSLTVRPWKVTETQYGEDRLPTTIVQGQTVKLLGSITNSHLANGPWKKSLNFIFLTKYGIRKSSKG